MRNITLTKRDSHFGDLVLISPGFALLEEPDIKMMAPPINEQPDVQINSRACTLLRNLLDSLQFGNQIVAVSGFRTQAEQEKIWNDSMKENGSEFTHEFVALPGHSEHQTGLAIDLGENKPPIDYIRPSFPYDGICEEFRKKAPLFGFIERYQKGKEPVTGISAEPWHFRYVGFPHSAVIAENDWSLEEYISFLKRTTSQNHPFCYQKGRASINIFYLAAEEKTEIAIPENSPFHFSGTNEGGIVMSIWRAENGKDAVSGN